MLKAAEHIEKTMRVIKNNQQYGERNDYLERTGKNQGLMRNKIKSYGLSRPKQKKG